MSFCRWHSRPFIMFLWTFPSPAVCSSCRQVLCPYMSESKVWQWCKELCRMDPLTSGLAEWNHVYIYITPTLHQSEQQVGAPHLKIFDWELLSSVHKMSVYTLWRCHLYFDTNVLIRTTCWYCFYKYVKNIVERRIDMCGPQAKKHPALFFSKKNIFTSNSLKWTLSSLHLQVWHSLWRTFH